MGTTAAGMIERAWEPEHRGRGISRTLGTLAPSKVFVSLLAALALLGTADTTTAHARDPWAPLHRPLRLEPLAAGTRCPVSAVHSVDHGRIGGAVGDGPIYPMPTPFDRYDRHPGWLGSKTIWAWPRNLVTHGTRVLVRGRRLDRPGMTRFQLGPQWDTAPLTTELRIDTTRTVGGFSKSSWGTTVTMLLVRTHGCYGFQLDSERGTSTIVLSTSRP